MTEPTATGGSRSLVARYWWIGGVTIAAIVAVLAAAFASGDPDGLDSVAIEQGFEHAATEPGFTIIPDYAFPGLEGTVATVVAGLIGIAIVLVVAVVVGRLLARRRKRTAG